MARLRNGDSEARTILISRYSCRKNKHSTRAESARLSFLISSSKPLHCSRVAVLHSPPTVACVVGRGDGRGEILDCAQEGWGMGLALLLLIWLITLASTYFFVAKTWWLPFGAAASAAFIDRQFTLTFLIMGVVFLAAQLGLGYIVWKYRESPSSPPVSYSHGNTTLEVV